MAIIIDFGTSSIDPSCFTVVVGRAFESCSLVIVVGRAVAAGVFVGEACPCQGLSCFDRMALEELELIFPMDSFTDNSTKASFVNSNYFASSFIAAIGMDNCFQLFNPKSSNFILLDPHFPTAVCFVKYFSEQIYLSY